MAEKSTAEMKQTLGLTGLTMNAMALIAPGAFLWLTFAIPVSYTHLDVYKRQLPALSCRLSDSKDGGRHRVFRHSCRRSIHPRP